MPLLKNEVTVVIVVTPANKIAYEDIQQLDNSFQKYEEIKLTNSMKKNVSKDKERPPYMEDQYK